MDKKMIVICAFLVVSIFIIIYFFYPSSSQVWVAEIVFHTDSGDVIFYCDVAENNSEKQRGLLDVDMLSSDEGMLFLYFDSMLRWFTMKDMKIPLDIIFVNESKFVVHIVEADIGDEHISSMYTSMYVIEINQGLATQYGIINGTKIDILLKND